MPNQHALAEYRGNGSATTSSTSWADDAFARVLNVPIRGLRRRGTPEEASPEFLTQLVHALRKTFPRTEDPATGDVVYEFRPRGFTQTPESEPVGQAFASLGHRARLLIDDALRALSNVKTIGTQDPELLRITRDVIREELDLLALELTTPEGQHHVEEIFNALLVTGGGGHIGDLRRRVVLSDDHVVSDEHEHILTSIRIVEDHVSCLRAEWQRLRDDGLITELDTSRMLEAVNCLGHTVDNVWDALAAEGLDQQCLDLVELPVDSTPQNTLVPIGLGPFLSEIERQVSFWRRIIESAGREGIEVIQPHAEAVETRLNGLLGTTLRKPAGRKGEVPGLLDVLLPRREDERFGKVWRLLALMQEQVREVKDIATAYTNRNYTQTAPVADRSGMR